MSTLLESCPAPISANDNVVCEEVDIKGRLFHCRSIEYLLETLVEVCLAALPIWLSSSVGLILRVGFDTAVYT